MPITPRVITDAQKTDIVKRRLLQIETEYFQHELNVTAGEELGGDKGQAQVAEAQAAMAELEIYHATSSAELDVLEAAEADPGA